MFLFSRFFLSFCLLKEYNFLILEIIHLSTFTLLLEVKGISNNEFWNLKIKQLPLYLTTRPYQKGIMKNNLFLLILISLIVVNLILSLYVISLMLRWFQIISMVIFSHFLHKIYECYHMKDKRRSVFLF